MTFLMALLAGFLGAAAGGCAGALLLAVLGAGSSTSGGTDIGTAFFLAAVFIPLGTLSGFAGAVVLVLRRRGIRALRQVATYLAGVTATIVCITGAIAWAYIFTIDDIMNPNGPTPLLAFEVRLPAGKPLPARNGVELRTDKNLMPGSWSPQSVRKEGDSTVVAGQVEMYFKVWNRLLAITLADKTEVLFNIDLPRRPPHSKTFDQWQRAEFVGSQRADAQSGYHIRYRAAWVGKD